MVSKAEPEAFQMQACTHLSIPSVATRFMPCALQEWLLQGHLACFIKNILENLFFKAFLFGLFGMSGMYEHRFLWRCINAAFSCRARHSASSRSTQCADNSAYRGTHQNTYRACHDSTDGSTTRRTGYQAATDQCRLGFTLSFFRFQGKLCC